MKSQLRHMMVEAGCENAVALAVGRMLGWSGGPASLEGVPRAWQTRLAQMLSDYDPRHLPPECVPMIVGIVAYYGGEDRVSVLLDEAKYKARRAREDGGDVLEMFKGERIGPRRVKPRRERGVA